MAKSYKLNDDIYIDDNSIIHKDSNNNRTNLNDLLKNLVNEGTGYIKFAEGTMICYGKTNSIRLTSTQMNASVNFPQEFIDVPMVVGSLDDAGSYKTSFSTGLGMTATKTSVNFNIKSLGDYSGSAIVSGNYIAIGRWK